MRSATVLFDAAELVLTNSMKSWKGQFSKSSAIGRKKPPFVPARPHGWFSKKIGENTWSEHVKLPGACMRTGKLKSSKRE
jgi:hypothetical protein